MDYFQRKRNTESERIDISIVGIHLINSTMSLNDFVFNKSPLVFISWAPHKRIRSTFREKEASKGLKKWNIIVFHNFKEVNFGESIEGCFWELLTILNSFLEIFVIMTFSLRFCPFRRSPWFIKNTTLYQRRI